MNYTNEITIQVPLEKVVKLMSDQENMKHWMPGLVSFELIEGVAGEKGAKTKMHFIMGKREIHMIETITRNESPHHFDAVYETKGVFNEQKNEFHEISPNETKWVSHSYFRMGGFMKLIGFLFPSSFKKQSQHYLLNFKAFAEEGKSVLEKH